MWRVFSNIVAISIGMIVYPVLLSSHDRKYWKDGFKLLLCLNRCFFLTLFCIQILDEFAAQTYFEALKSSSITWFFSILLGCVYTSMRLSQDFIYLSKVILLHRYLAHSKKNSANFKGKSNSKYELKEILFTFIPIATGIFLLGSTYIRMHLQNQFCNSLLPKEIWEDSLPRVIFRNGFFQGTLCSYELVLRVDASNKGLSRLPDKSVDS